MFTAKAKEREKERKYKPKTPKWRDTRAVERAKLREARQKSADIDFDLIE